MRSRLFCCCLPVRFGVFVMSGFQLLAGGGAAGLLWFVIAKDDQLAGSARTAFIVMAGVLSAIAAAALLGFFGAISRARGLVATYATMLWVLLVAHLAASVYFLIVLFRDGASALAAQCETASSKLQAGAGIKSGDIDTSACDGVLHTSKWVYVANIVVALLVQAYGAHIASSYVAQLRDEEDSAARYNRGPALLQPQGGYPYRDASHSFGKETA